MGNEQQIWAPWRIGYIAGEAKSAPPLREPSNWLPQAEQTCFLCRAAASYEADLDANRQNLVVAAGQQTLAILNRYPYTNGHLLIAPLRHVGQFCDITDEEHLEAIHQLKRFNRLLSRLISAEGFNIGLNLGKVAGAGVPGHLHWHLVPRWQGDNNFMPTLAGTRVISQSLEALWEDLVAAVKSEG